MNRRTLPSLLGLIALLMPMLLWAAPQQLILSHVVSPDTPKGKMAEMFKSIIEKKLGDRYEIIIHSNASLMDDDEAVTAIAEGRIHFAAPSLSKFESYTQQLKVFDLPFLFPDMNAVNRFQKSPTGQALLSSMESQGILGLGYLHNGLKQLTADRPFTRPEDLAGLRFRTMNSDVLIKQFELLNAEAVPMAFSKVYESLANRSIQGQENTWSNIFSQAFYDHQPYMMISNHGVLDYMLITNSVFWSGLSEEERRSFRFALEMSLKYGNAVAKAKSANDKIELGRMKGVSVYEPSADELTVWQTAMQPLWASYEGLIGEKVIQAAQQAGRP
ncbi:DctP family TRAP transporter solute-binding subunit [Marinobacter sp. 1-4A]|uniref:DctP family TRAP transporter solute-binding subunit n=1 Tax=Marinobacter sp. 1-4A TaxID=2582919 RepID=UPI0019059FC2|nr:DctP family TRAP transporter solute-binding subunit [Marinobacter sp. 1-4A]MBK1852983.1 DctP family TRAP transporter solute-binding subunit [Marinobacter sp. 1-4A]